MRIGSVIEPPPVSVGASAHDEFFGLAGRALGLEPSELPDPRPGISEPRSLSGGESTSVIVRTPRWANPDRGSIGDATRAALEGAALAVPISPYERERIALATA
jgi:hypothetical protein